MTPSAQREQLLPRPVKNRPTPHSTAANCHLVPLPLPAHCAPPGGGSRGPAPLRSRQPPRGRGCLNMAEAALPPEWRLYLPAERAATFRAWPFTEGCACTPGRVSRGARRGRVGWDEMR